MKENDFSPLKNFEGKQIDGCSFHFGEPRWNSCQRSVKIIKIA